MSVGAKNLRIFLKLKDLIDDLISIFISFYECTYELMLVFKGKIKKEKIFMLTTLLESNLFI
jgi:hypothetical protein